MDKNQFQAEIDKRIAILKNYIAEVQKIKNYSCDVECQSFIPSVNNLIKKIRQSSTKIKALGDSEFNSYDVAGYLKGVDDMMKTPEAGFRHIKSKGPIPPKHQYAGGTTRTRSKLSKANQASVTEMGFDEPGMC